MEKNLKNNIQICITESLSCAPETNTTLQIKYTSTKKKKKEAGTIPECMNRSTLFKESLKSYHLKVSF